MRNFWRKMRIYAELPEMSLFWIFLPILIVLSVIDVMYLPNPWGFISLGIFLVLISIFVFSSLRLTRSNLEIKVERNELSSIIFNLNDGIIAYDPGFKILIFNRAAEGIFDVPAAATIGKIFSPDRSQEKNYALLIQVMFPSLAPVVINRSTPGTFPQVSDLSFDNHGLQLRVTTDKIIDPNGELLGFVKIVRDRTREVELIRSKTDFISIAAHQLRTPLSAVHWALEGLVAQGLNDEQKETATLGLGASIKMLKTLNDLLDVTKIEEGRYGYKFETVELATFVESVIRGVKELHGESSVKIYLQKPDKSINVIIDQEKMNIALTNLVDNAIKYNVQNGEVVVSIELLKDTPYVQISVKDTGLGIPKEDMQKLFTRFFRAQNAIETVSEGTGLGLYIVKNIIKRHGGEIWVESELNRGSTFYFTLPLNEDLIPPKEIVYGDE